MLNLNLIDIDDYDKLLSDIKADNRYVNKIEKYLKGLKINENQSFNDDSWFFGDSKVVDKSGNPLVVYHGSANKFDRFDPKTIGDNYIESEHTGFFFTQKERSAKNYAKLHSKMKGGYVYEVYLKIENPLVRKTNSDYYRPADIFDMKRTVLMNEVMNEGHDGIIIYGTDNDNLYVVLEPEQIKILKIKDMNI